MSRDGKGGQLKQNSNEKSLARGAASGRGWAAALGGRRRRKGDGGKSLVLYQLLTLIVFDYRWVAQSGVSVFSHFTAGVSHFDRFIVIVHANSGRV